MNSYLQNQVSTVGCQSRAEERAKLSQKIREIEWKLRLQDIENKRLRASVTQLTKVNHRLTDANRCLCELVEHLTLSSDDASSEKSPSSLIPTISPTGGS